MSACRVWIPPVSRSLLPACLRCTQGFIRILSRIRVTECVLCGWRDGCQCSAAPCVAGVMPVAPSPSSPHAPRSLHPLTGTPPRRNGSNKALPLSPLSAKRRLAPVSTSGIPVPPSSPRSLVDPAEQDDLEEIERLEQRLNELDMEEQSRAVAARAPAEQVRSQRRPEPATGAGDSGAVGMMSLPDDVLERIVLAAERSLLQLSATCRRFRALVTSAEFDAVWLGQCALLLGNSAQNFRALHGCGAARSAGRSGEPVWRIIAIELHSGRAGGGGQAFAVHPAALCFKEANEEAKYFGLISRVLADSPVSSGSEIWYQWKHAPLRWQTGEQNVALVEEFWGPDQSIKIELVIGAAAAAGRQKPLEAGGADSAQQNTTGEAGTNVVGATTAAARIWCTPHEVLETRILYRAKFAVNLASSDSATAVDQWEMSISYNPDTLLYVLHYLRSSTKPVGELETQTDAGADEDEFQFAEDRLLIQLGSWYEIPLTKLDESHGRTTRRMYDMYWQEDPGTELALYLQDAQSFCATATQRYAQLQDGALRAVATSAGASGQELQQAREQVNVVEDWVAARVAALRLHGSEFHAALRRGWRVLQSAP